MKASVKMKSFQTILDNLAVLGICPDRSTHSFPFNMKILVLIIFTPVVIFSYFGYLLNVAKSLSELIDRIIATSSAITFSITFYSIIFQMTDLFEVIDNMERMIAISEYIFFGIHTKMSEERCRNENVDNEMQHIT